MKITMFRFLIFISFFGMLHFLHVVPASSLEGKLAGKHIVFIIAEGWWHTKEYSDLNELFQNEGAEITVASSTLNKISRAGTTVSPKVLVKDINSEKIDAIVFIGGFGCLQYRDDLDALKIIREMVDKEKVVGALHDAVLVLAEAGVLNGKRVRGSSPEILQQKGAIVSEKVVEKDGNVITTYPDANYTIEFGETFLSALLE